MSKIKKKLLTNFANVVRQHFYLPHFSSLFFVLASPPSAICKIQKKTVGQSNLISSYCKERKSYFGVWIMKPIDTANKRLHFQQNDSKEVHRKTPKNWGRKWSHR